jgi:murein DD-endopeptidase MepM/ murein hydrolase activator NlpD
MKHLLFLILGFLLVGCSSIFRIPQLPPSPTSEIFPIEKVPSSPLSPTLTSFVSSADIDTSTYIPSGTPIETLAATLVWTLFETPALWSYVFPIQPSSLAEFAQGDASHGYPATDIFAPAGSKYVAIADGVVDFVSYEDLWEPTMDNPALRGGLCVAIIGDDGVRYYGSHLSAIQPGIEPGGRVYVGQVLGLVGNSGDARKTPPHLHFGISHPTQPDDWRVRRGEIDPFPFLLAWRDSHIATPNLAEISKDTVTRLTSLFTYVFPVQPLKNANYNEGGHGYPATDIFSPAGSQYVAATGGVVDSVSVADRWDPDNTEAGLSGGLWVSFLGDDGVHYYGAHLSVIAPAIQVGVRVRAGDLLGLIGNSGDAQGTLPHLHFEISRQTSASEWMSRDGLMDPFPFLEAWKTGHNVTPPKIIP